MATATSSAAIAAGAARSFEMDVLKPYREYVDQGRYLQLNVVDGSAVLATTADKTAAISQTQFMDELQSNTPGSLGARLDQSPLAELEAFSAVANREHVRTYAIPATSSIPIGILSLYYYIFGVCFGKEQRSNFLSFLDRKPNITPKQLAESRVSAKRAADIAQVDTEYSQSYQALDREHQNTVDSLERNRQAKIQALRNGVQRPKEEEKNP